MKVELSPASSLLIGSTAEWGPVIAAVLDLELADMSMTEVVHGFKGSIVDRIVKILESIAVIFRSSFQDLLAAAWQILGMTLNFKVLFSCT